MPVLDVRIAVGTIFFNLFVALLLALSYYFPKWRRAPKEWLKECQIRYQIWRLRRIGGKGGVLRVSALKSNHLFFRNKKTRRALWVSNIEELESRGVIRKVSEGRFELL